MIKIIRTYLKRKQSERNFLAAYNYAVENLGTAPIEMLGE